MPLLEKLTDDGPFAKCTLIGALLLIACLHPSTGNTAEEAKPPKPAKSPDDVICKREKISGSHIKQRICFTRQQWDDIRRNSQNTAAAAMRGGGPITPR